ncbi:zinc-ribbon domain-containing protein [Microbacterium azadirachtae]|uniref:zinc-ribbon domain-containing protein n=1 Tax=Microbacterium azadirachtae TaxID=582680 RepID=UPI003F74C726
MTNAQAWAIRPKWHRFESAHSYARRQCQAAGIPLLFVERGLKSASHQYRYQVWADGAVAADTIEAAAGRPEGHYRRLMRQAQPDPDIAYPQRFLCRLCAAGDCVEQIPHDRENWCLRHPGQLVWTGVGSTPESQVVIPWDSAKAQAHAERRFRRMVTAGRVSARLHGRVWEMVRDNAWLTRPDGWIPDLSHCLDDHEVRGRAALYPETVVLLGILSNASTVKRWRALSSNDLRQAIAATLPSGWAPINVLVERIVLWLRPLRREIRATRVDPLDVPRDIVETSAIIDVTANYPLWIQRRPHAIAEWDWARNDHARDPWGPLGTSVKAWWVCDAGHSWESTPYVRAIAGCPYCSGLSTWRGQADLGTLYPLLAAEWDTSPGANAGDPDHVGPGSNRRIRWICSQGHRWIATINNRARNGSGCPYCGGSRATPGETDLATLHPDLAAEWDHERNGKLSPNTISARTTKRVWWLGRCGHNWQAAIANRTNGTRCPYCAGKRALPGVSDLATLRPDLAAQWHDSNELRPEHVRPNSGKKVTWQCDAGHVWEAPVYARSGAGQGCPYCSGHRVTPGETDLATLHPELAREWDASNTLRPQEVSAGSDRRVKWKCAEGHIWEATISSRTSKRPAGCPSCFGHRAVPGVDDLETLRPDLAAEWDATNAGSPDRVKASSRRMVNWRCAHGHVWEATVASRSSDSSCPACEAGAHLQAGQTETTSFTDSGDQAHPRG